MTDALALADEYETGMKKCMASGYEEYGPDFQQRHQLIIDALRFYASAQPQSLTGCLHPIGPLSCQNQGKCQSVACNHYGKTECRPRRTVLARDPNVFYPKDTI